MRVFSIFVSALAFANLAQATPLTDTEFGQLEAELELEAGLPITKADGVELIKQMTKVTDMAINGFPSTTEKNVKKQHWKDSLNDGYGDWVDYYTDVTTSNVDKDELH